MTKFLNDFADNKRQITDESATEFQSVFARTVQLAQVGLPARPFRPERALNAAVFDSMMVGLASRLRQGPVNRVNELTEAYQSLLRAPEYVDAYRRATADEEKVKARMKLAIEAFSRVP
jgi:hypothetical protein